MARRGRDSAPERSRPEAARPDLQAPARRGRDSAPERSRPEAARPDLQAPARRGGDSAPERSRAEAARPDVRAPASLPRVLIAGLRGGSGKTLVTVGLVAAWRSQGRSVAVFKKGPDYIDAAWLTRAAGRPCRNLDLFLQPAPVIVRSVLAQAAAADLVLIEGNRGLYDGLDAQGSCSTAELAKLLGAPVILVVDVTKSTRTTAALVLGCQQLDRWVPIRGVILNRVSGSRHEAVARQAIQDACDLPVLGALPRLAEDPFPERHLGLLPPQEHAAAEPAVERAASLASEYLDLAGIAELAAHAPQLHDRLPLAEPLATTVTATPVRIGVFRDEAFQFYYPENLEALTRAGAVLVEISPLRAERLPSIDALYLGGGFPETFAPQLAANTTMRDSLRAAIGEGLPVYAECGGAVYLGERLEYEGSSYPMAGVLPASFTFSPRPRGHGYVVLETVAANPFFTPGEVLRGHEFHYTALAAAVAPDEFVFRVQRGYGFDGAHDGLCRGSVLASYTHLHALSSPAWAPALVQAARRFCTTAPTGAAVAD